MRLKTQERRMTRPPIHLWSLSTPIEKLMGGHRNTAFRTTGLRQNFVFKTTRRSVAAIDWLGEVHDLAQKAGILVPKLLQSTRGNLVENGWTCEPFLAGRAFIATDMHLLRPHIEKFHQLTKNTVQRPGFLCAKELLIKNKGGDVDFSAMPEDITRICRLAWSGIALEKRAVIHGDLNPANLILGRDRKIGVLDWDECRVDTPDFDIGQIMPKPDIRLRLALNAWEVACSWRLEPEYARECAARLLQRADGLL